MFNGENWPRKIRKFVVTDLFSFFTIFYVVYDSSFITGNIRSL